MASTSWLGNIGGESRTILWCVPRSVSTALTKCLSFIDGNEVWFEPYCYCHLTRMEYAKHTNKDIPMEYEGNEDIFNEAKKLLDVLIQTETEPDRLSYGSVKRRLEATTAKHVFVKDMTSGMTELGFGQYLPIGYRHTFIIRHPIRSINSYRKSIYKQYSDIGMLQGEASNEKTFDIERDDYLFPKGYFFGELYDLWKYVKGENIDPNPIIIDGDDLLTKPAETLRAYCAEVGLPYNDGLLQWDASVERLKKMNACGENLLMDLVNFYGTAMKSSCFLPPSKFPSRDQLPADVIRCSDKVMPYFDEMFEARLKV